MHDISKKISGYIENHFPAVYREDGPVLVDFVQAYFEFLERNDFAATKLNRSMFANRDIDETLDSFIIHFKEQFLKDFNFSTVVDKRFMIKHIMDYYRSKGTPRAAKLLLRLVFNEDAEVYYPGRDILKPSDSRWFIPTYLELSRSVRTPSLINQQIQGSKSGATAFVESIVTKRIQGRLIDVAYLSNVRGTFVNGEYVSSDSSIINSPQIIGSLSSLTVVNGGQNNVVGDIFNVIDDTGKQGLARVTAIENATGRVNFDLVDGGSGYTLNTPDDGDPTNDYTDIRVATAMIFVDNANTENQFLQFETVRQDKARIITVSGDDLVTSYANATPGDYLLGVKTYVDSYTANSVNGPSFDRSQSTDLIVVTVDGDVIANTEYTVTSGNVVFDVDPTDGALIKLVNYVVAANGIISSITESEANTISDVVVTSGTFGPQVSIDFANDAPFSNTSGVGEIIYEEQDWTLTVDDTSGFANDDVVEMKVYSVSAGNVTYLSAYAYGTVANVVNSSVMSLTNAFGTFEDDGELQIINDPSANATIIDVSLEQAGATGVLSGQTDANTWLVNVISGSFTPGKLVIGQRSRLVELIDTVANTAVTDIWYNGNPASNGVIDTVSNTSVSGIVVGQNTTSVGLYGNTSAFLFVEGAGMTIYTKREDIKEHDLVARPNLQPQITRLGTGDNATFQPGSLENEENVTLNTDLLGANNTANVAFMDITIDASNSGVGFVDSVTVHDGGTLYSNGQTLTFSGGGYADGNPRITAVGTVTTNGSGVITAITMTNPGEGYFDTPSFTLPSTSGNVANVSINMDFGYGFALNPGGDANTPFSDLFTYDTFTIGTITSLNRINPGSNYNANPFVSVYNQYIAGFERKNILLSINIVSGSFAVGETIYQGGVAKGLVLSASDTYLTLKRVSFNTSFNTATNISGATSNAVASVNSVADVANSLAMGENAIVTGEVLVADGIATSLEVVDSGYGYLGGQTVTLEKSGNPFIVTATALVETQGIGSGYWTDTNSHLNSEKKLHDNRYYQEYSYDIQTGVSLDKYRRLVKDILHVSGTQLFGTVTRNSNININTVAATTTVNTVSTS
jgi:hypothetical protein